MERRDTSRTYGSIMQGASSPSPSQQEAKDEEDAEDEDHQAGADREDYSCYTSVEVLQLLCNLEEALALGPKFKLQKEKDRPLMQYFHRSVAKVRARSHLWISQLVIHNITTALFTCTRASTAILGEKVWQVSQTLTNSVQKGLGATREEILRNVQDGQEYWENIAAAHRHTNKILLPSLRESSESPPPQPFLRAGRGAWGGTSPTPTAQTSVENPRSFSTLGMYSPRTWPREIRTRCGLASRPGTGEGVKPCQNYLDLLLLQQEYESARNSKTTSRPNSVMGVPTRQWEQYKEEERRHQRFQANDLRLSSCNLDGHVPDGFEDVQGEAEDFIEMADRCNMDMYDSGRQTIFDGGLSGPQGQGRLSQALEEVFQVGGRLTPNSFQSAGRRSPRLASGRNSVAGRRNSATSPGPAGRSQMMGLPELEAYLRGPQSRAEARSRVETPMSARAQTAPGERHGTLRRFGREAPADAEDPLVNLRANTALGCERGSERSSGQIFKKLPPVVHLEGNPLRRPGQARIPMESTEDRILCEFVDEEICQPEENEAHAEVQYYRSCKELSILPTKRDFLQQATLDDINLGDQGLTDEQFQALTSAIVKQAPSLQVLDLSHNKTLSHKSLTPIMEGLAAKRPVLQVLKLGGLFFSHPTIDTLKRMMKAAVHLKEVCLQSSQLPESAWGKLCQGIKAATSIVRLDLSNTSCGRWQQQACLSVAKCLSDHESLESADLSANYFRHEGLCSLGSALANNSCGLLVLTLDDNACADGGQDSNSGASHPMVTFCEMLRLNKSLRQLNMCRSAVSVMAGCCLEDALPSHPQLREVYLTDNPLGEEGFRAVLRGMLKGRSSKLEFIDVTKLRDSVLKPDVAFHFSDLTESYVGSRALSCELPYHRSVLRLILRRVEDFTHSPSHCMKELTINGEKPERLPFKKERPGVWQVPSRGRVEFRLELPSPSQAKTGDELIDKWQRVRRLPVATTKFVHFHRTVASMASDFEVCSLIEMIARDCLLKNVHLKLLVEAVSEHKPKLIPIILPHLVLAIPKVDRACINSSLLYLASSKPVLAKRLQETSLMRLKEMLRFNAGNPNGRYELDLANPMQYAVAERVFTLNNWESHLAHNKKRPDTSEAGNHDAIRNFTMDGVVQTHKMDWEMPGDGYVGRGHLLFDYVSLIMPTAKSKPLHEDVFEHIVSVLRGEGTDVKEVARYSALHLVSHRFIITARQLAKMLEAFPDASRRVDLYCEIYCRCNEFGAPLVDMFKGVLGDQPGWGIFTGNDRLAVIERIGLINTIDWTNVHHDPYWGNKRDGGRAAVFGTLKQQPRNRYVFNLEKRDDHMLANLLLQLADKEPGNNLMLASWTGAPKNIFQPNAKWTLPQSWLEGSLPMKGVFEVTYVVEKRSYLNAKSTRDRQLMGHEVGWVADKIKHPPPEMDPKTPPKTPVKTPPKTPTRTSPTFSTKVFGAA